MGRRVRVAVSCAIISATVSRRPDFIAASLADKAEARIGDAGRAPAVGAASDAGAGGDRPRRGGLALCCPMTNSQRGSRSNRGLRARGQIAGVVLHSRLSRVARGALFWSPAFAII